MITEIWTYHDQRVGELDLAGFTVETRDGVVGHVDRATRDVDRSYLVIDAGTAMPLGRRVVLPAGVVDTVDLDDRRVSVSVGRDDILSAPEFDPDRPLDENLRDRIGSYYTSAGRERARPRSTRSQRSAKTSSRATSSSRTASTRAGSDEPTKEELYAQAKKLNIDGRSKMNKAQLKRAVESRK